MNSFLSLRLRGVLCSVALAASTFAADFNWKPLLDPGVGGFVDAVAVSPTDPNRVLAGGDILGISLSTDGGITWQDTSGFFRSYEISQFTFHPTEPLTVWAGTMGGPVKSVDGGKTWETKRTGFPALVFGRYVSPVEKVLFDPADARRLLAFTGDRRRHNPNAETDIGRVYQSLDGGETWALLSIIAADRSINGAEYQPGSLTRLYAATSFGAYVSEDNGVSWTRFNNLINPATGAVIAGTNAVVVTPDAPDTVLVVVGSLGVFKSLDGGATFAPANAGLPTGTYYDVAIQPGAPQVFFTGDRNSNRAYKSVDGGATWTRMTGFDERAYKFAVAPTCFAVDRANPQRVFLGSPVTIWRTDDAGTTWQDVSSSLVGTAPDQFVGNGFSGQVALDYVFNPYNPTESSMVALDSGKWMSRDDLQSFVFGGGGYGRGLDDYFGTLATTFTATAGTQYIVQGQNGILPKILKTTNGGQNWQARTNPSSSSPGNETSIYADPLQPERVWVVWNSRLYRSTDSGGSWTEVAGPDATPGVISRVRVVAPFDPANANAIYIAADQGVFVSTDGVTFAPLPASNAGPKRILRLEVDPASPSTRLYTITKDDPSGTDGIWTWDSGTWTRLSSNALTSQVRFAADIAVDPANPQRVLVATNIDQFTSFISTGMWVSDERGAPGTWRQVNDGLPFLRVRSVTYNPDGSGTVVIGTNGRGYYVSRPEPAVVDDRLPFSADLSFTTLRSWATGSNGELRITNTGTETIRGWVVRFTLAAEISALWNGRVVREGSDYTVTDAGWNATIAPGATATVGFQIAGPAALAPTNSTLNALDPAQGAESVAVAFSRTNGWSTGFNGTITLTNTGEKAVRGWALAFTLPAGITSLWNGAVTRAGDTYTVTDAGWNAIIAPGASVSFGFQVNGTASAEPTDFLLRYGAIGGR